MPNYYHYLTVFIESYEGLCEPLEPGALIGLLACKVSRDLDSLLSLIVLHKKNKEKLLPRTFCNVYKL